MRISPKATRKLNDVSHRETRFPSIESLRAFEAVTRLGSYEKVAQELSITASAVAKRIAALESLLGVALLERNGRALALSAAGKEYLGQVQSVLAELAARSVTISTSPFNSSKHSPVSRSSSRQPANDSCAKRTHSGSA